MKLGEWLKQEEITQAAFAERIGSGQGHVSDLVHGKVRPRLESIARIQTATNNAVTAQDWMDATRPKRVRLEKLKAAVKKVAR